MLGYRPTGIGKSSITSTVTANPRQELCDSGRTCHAAVNDQFAVRAATDFERRHSLRLRGIGQSDVGACMDPHQIGATPAIEDGEGRRRGTAAGSLAHNTKFPIILQAQSRITKLSGRGNHRDQTPWQISSVAVDRCSAWFGLHAAIDPSDTLPNVGTIAPSESTCFCVSIRPVSAETVRSRWH